MPSSQMIPYMTVIDRSGRFARTHVCGERRPLVARLSSAFVSSFWCSCGTMLWLDWNDE